MSQTLDQDAIKRIEKRIKTKYQVVFYGDSVTDSYVVGTYSTRSRARNKADKLDCEYGAYRYSVKAVEVA